MLDDTLVIWGGEFGRTSMRENRGGTVTKFFGRDHNPKAFTMWMAGGGVKARLHFRRDRSLGYNAVENPVHLRDFHATILHLLGIDHRQAHLPIPRPQAKTNRRRPRQHHSPNSGVAGMKF